MTAIAAPLDISVSFRRRVLAANGQPVSHWSNWERNLITDVGLDMPVSAPWRALLSYIAVGTGTRATKRDSGAITVTRAGTAGTASAAFFVAEDVGRTIKLDSGAVTKVTAVTSGTACTFADSGSDAASEFTIWYGSDSYHEAETVAFATSIQGISIAGNVWTITRRGISAAFTEPKVLREIGWRPSATGALFGRALIPGGGDSVAAGQQYQVDVALSITVSPSTPTAQGNVGTGMDTTGTAGWTYWGTNATGANLMNLRIIGDVYANIENCGAEPNASAISLRAAYDDRTVGALAYGYISNAQTYPAAAVNKSGYVGGSHRVTWTASYGTGTSLGPITSLVVGSTEEVFRHKFTTPFTKTSLQTLSLSFTVSWDRVLQN